jgi:hypothetical protein
MQILRTKPNTSNPINIAATTSKETKILPDRVLSRKPACLMVVVFGFALNPLQPWIYYSLLEEDLCRLRSNPPV